MDVQECGVGFELRDTPDDPQCDIIRRQIDFQKRVGHWNPNLCDFGSKPFCLPRRVLHHLDMAVQECSEAWDMVEGGWKHHKTQPKECDPVELLMELVDVHHFIVNGYLMMGGQPESDMVAAAVGRSREELKLPRIGLDDAWDMGARSWLHAAPKIESVYGHSMGAHGRSWEMSMATRINFLRCQLFKVTSAIRTGLETMSRQVARRSFPASSGYVYIELMPWLMVAYQGLPSESVGEVTPQLVYSAFCHKSDINHARQDGGY